MPSVIMNSLEHASATKNHDLTRRDSSPSSTPATTHGTVSRFTPSTPFLYFRHVVDPARATLKVEVLGPNLSHTFHHSRARKRLTQSKVSASLDRKTTGFLALVRHRSSSSSGRTAESSNMGDLEADRTVLAWAESGHAAGKEKELVDSGPGLFSLSNGLWTRRVILVAHLLGHRMARPFDTMGAPVHCSRHLRGIFQASHVEVKLATHAIYLLLRLFPPPPQTGAATAATTSSSKGQTCRPSRCLTRRALRSLRSARWSDGSRPRFEIIFSRKNCGSCGAFVRKLARLTGVEMTLRWGQRLAPVVYAQQGLRKAACAPATAQSGVVGDEEDDGEAAWTDEDEDAMEGERDGKHGEGGRDVDKGLDAMQTIDLTADAEPITPRSIILPSDDHPNPENQGSRGHE